jgi:2-oxoglutarate dehydrogenase E1 component
MGGGGRKLAEKIVIAWIKQLCPFSHDLVRAEVQKYGKAELCWGQEEHKKSGSRSYVFQRSGKAAGVQREAAAYAGRGPSASTTSAVKPFSPDRRNS